MEKNDENQRPSNSSRSDYRCKQTSDSVYSMARFSKANYMKTQMSSSSPANLIGSQKIQASSMAQFSKGQRFLSNISTSSHSNLTNAPNPGPSRSYNSSIVQGTEKQRSIDDNRKSLTRSSSDITNSQRNAKATTDSTPLSTLSNANLSGGIKNKQKIVASSVVQLSKGQHSRSHVSTSSRSNTASTRNPGSSSPIIEQHRSSNGMSTSLPANYSNRTVSQRKVKSNLASAAMSFSTIPSPLAGFNSGRNTDVNSLIVQPFVAKGSTSLPQKLKDNQNTDASCSAVEQKNVQSLTPPVSKSLPSHLLGNVNERFDAASSLMANRLKNRSKENSRKFFSSTVKHVNSKCDFGSNFSTITSEEDFSSVEKKESVSSTSSPAQSISPITKAALANIAELQSI